MGLIAFVQTLPSLCNEKFNLHAGEHGADLPRGGACPTWPASSPASGKRPGVADSGKDSRVITGQRGVMLEIQVPELEELLNIPAEALQKELCLSREEVPEYINPS